NGNETGAPRQPHATFLRHERSFGGGGELLLAATDGHDAGGLGGGQGGKVGLETGREYLEDPLRVLEVFEPVLSEVLERDVLEGGSDQVARRRRHEDLAAV